MQRWLRLLVRAAGEWAARAICDTSWEAIKAKAADLYVESVHVVRAMYLSAVFISLGVALALIGFIILHVGLFLLLPRPAAAALFTILGGLYLVVGLIVVCRLASRNHWMKITRADRCRRWASGDREA